MKEYRIGNAIVVVQRPQLTEAEQQKQEEQIKISLQQFERRQNNDHK